MNGRVNGAAALPRAGATLRIGTRGSALALTQTRLTVEALRARWPGLDIEVHTITTTGDDPTPVFIETQLAAVMNGRLHTWTQVNTSQVIASLEVDGSDIATVPFTLDGDRWLFDYAAASGIGSTP